VIIFHYSLEYIHLRNYPRVEDNGVLCMFCFYLLVIIILDSRITNIARSAFSKNFDKYLQLEDNIVIFKFDYFIKYSSYLYFRINVSNFCFIIRIIKLLLSTSLIANYHIL
jgi:hypothetical protein